MPVPLAVYLFVAYTYSMLSTKDAAAKLGISTRRVLALIESGRLRAEKVGRDWVIAEKDLAAFRPLKRGRPPGRPKGRGKK